MSAAALSKEQRQLLTVFRAQLQAMDTPIQQYYIKNPHLIIQKALLDIKLLLEGAAMQLYCGQ